MNYVVDYKHNGKEVLGATVKFANLKSNGKSISGWVQLEKDGTKIEEFYVSCEVLTNSMEDDIISKIKHLTFLSNLTTVDMRNVTQELSPIEATVVETEQKAPPKKKGRAKKNSA